MNGIIITILISIIIIVLGAEAVNRAVKKNECSSYQTQTGMPTKYDNGYCYVTLDDGVHRLDELIMKPTINTLHYPIIRIR